MAEQLICNQQVVGSTPITSSTNLGEFPSGQRGQTVNLLSLTSLVRIQLPPPNTKDTYHQVGVFCILRESAFGQVARNASELVRICTAERRKLAWRRQGAKIFAIANTQLQIIW